MNNYFATNLLSIFYCLQSSFAFSISKTDESITKINHVFISYYACFFPKNSSLRKITNSFNMICFCSIFCNGINTSGPAGYNTPNMFWINKKTKIDISYTPRSIYAKNRFTTLRHRFLSSIPSITYLR